MIVRAEIVSFGEKFESRGRFTALQKTPAEEKKCSCLML
jgi:hypothetical protein